LIVLKAPLNPTNQLLFQDDLAKPVPDR